MPLSALYKDIKDPFTKTSRLGARVKFFVDGAEAVVIDVGVNLGSSDVGVAEHLLEGSEIDAAGEHVGCEAVAEGVDGKLFAKAGAGGVFFDDPPEVNAVEGTAGAGKEEPLMAVCLVELGAELFKVLQDAPAGDAAEGDDPFLAALAETSDIPYRKINILNF